MGPRNFLISGCDAVKVELGFESHCVVRHRQDLLKRVSRGKGESEGQIFKASELYESSKVKRVLPEKAQRCFNW